MAKPCEVGGQTGKRRKPERATATETDSEPERGGDRACGRETAREGLNGLGMAGALGLDRNGQRAPPAGLDLPSAV